jgi:RimJ/RimL family protein N-acetyltransferase
MLFNEVGVDEVFAPIRPENQPSIKVAEKLGFEVRGEYNKYYNGKDMPHLIYALIKPSNEK